VTPAGGPSGEGGIVGRRSRSTGPLRAAFADCLQQVLLAELRKSWVGDPVEGLDLDALFCAARGPFQRHNPSVWTRGRLERAVDDLVGAGRVRLEAMQGAVVVHPIPPVTVADRRATRPPPPPRPAPYPQGS
jgi:hypothetical protein